MTVYRTLLLAAALIVSGCERQAELPPRASAKGVDRSSAGKPIPDVEIRGPDGEAQSLAQLSGEPALINLWATWCAPCVKELPTLAALESKPGAPRVVIISQDMAPRATVDAFLARHKLELESWHDPDMALSGALGAQVLPTTIFYGADGRERWRYVGDLDWTGPEAARLIGEVSREAAR